MYVNSLFQTKHDDLVTLSGPCVITGKPYQVTVTAKSLEIYLSGALAQNAFPQLSPDEREFLISGCSPDGWETCFGGGAT